MQHLQDTPYLGAMGFWVEVLVRRVPAAGEGSIGLATLGLRLSEALTKADGLALSLLNFGGGKTGEKGEGKDSVARAAWAAGDRRDLGAALKPDPMP